MKPPRASLSRLLAGLALGCLLPGLVGVGLLLGQWHRDALARAEADTVQAAHALAQAVDVVWAQGRLAGPPPSPVVRGTVDDEAYAALLRQQALPAGWAGRITDREGAVVARWPPPGTLAEPPWLPVLPFVAQGNFETVTAGGKPALGAFSAAPLSGWRVALTVPLASLSQPLRQQFVQAGTGFLMLFGLGGWMAWRQGGRITRSVRHVTNAAVAMPRNEQAATAQELHFIEAEVAARAIARSAQVLADRERARLDTLQALQASTARLEAALGSMGDAVLICDARGRYVEFNEAFASFHRFGSKPECPQTLAAFLDILDVFDSEGHPVPPHDWPVMRALRGERASDVEYGLHRKDTQQRWFASHSFAPIRDAEGNIAGAVVAGRDITEQHARAAELALAQARLHLALRAASAGLWDWDIVANTQTWSEEMFRLFRRNAETDTPGLDLWRGVVHPEDRAHAEERALHAVRDHVPLSSRYRIVLPSGELRWIHAYGDTVYGPQGQGLRMRGICVDATAQHRADEHRQTALRLEAENLRVMETARLQGQFFANMSHELRTPLGAIIGFADLIHAGALEEDAARRHHFVGHIRQSARHLSRLIDDVLDLSRFDAGEFEFFPEPVDLLALINEVRDVLYPSMLARRIAISVAFDPSLLGLVLDPVRIKQVLYNYLSNAIKFSTADGCIQVRALPDGSSRFRIEVEDAGIGIDAADLPRLFVDFQQLDAGFAKRHQGTGMGLALTRRLVEAQGGTAGVRSTLGEGSVFYVVLARVQAQAPARAQARAPQHAPADRVPAHVDWQESR